MKSYTAHTPSPAKLLGQACQGPQTSRLGYLARVTLPSNWNLGAKAMC